MTTGRPTAHRHTPHLPVRNGRKAEVAPQHKPADKLQQLQKTVGNRGMRQLLGGVRGLVGEVAQSPATMSDSSRCLGTASALAAEDRTWLERSAGPLPEIALHEGHEAGAMLNSASAEAAARGRRIALPASTGPQNAKRALLAHELAHVLQQGALHLPLAYGETLEQDADGFARAAMSGLPARVHHSAPMAWAFKKKTVSKGDMVKEIIVVIDSRHVEVVMASGDRYGYTWSKNSIPAGRHTGHKTARGLQVDIPGETILYFQGKTDVPPPMSLVFPPVFDVTVLEAAAPVETPTLAETTANPKGGGGVETDPSVTKVTESISAEMAELEPLVTRLAADVPLHPADHALNEVRNLEARIRGDEKALRDFEAVAGGTISEVHSAVNRLQVMRQMLAPAVAAAAKWHEANPAGESLGMMNERYGTWMAGAAGEQWDKGGLHYVPGALAYVGTFGIAFVDAAEKVASLGFHDAATAVSQAYTRGDISWNEGEAILKSAAWRALLTAAVTRGAGMATSRLGVMGAEATGLASTTLRYGAVAGAIPGGLSATAALGTQALLTKGLEDRFNSPAAKAIWNQAMPQGKDWAIAIPLGILMGGLGGMRGVEIANDKLVGSIINTPEGPMQVVTVTQLKLTTSGGKLGVTQPGVMVLKPVGSSLSVVPAPPASALVMVLDPLTNTWVYPKAPPTGLATVVPPSRPVTASGGTLVPIRPSGALAGASGPAVAGASPKQMLPAAAKKTLVLPPGLKPPRRLPPGPLPPLQLQPWKYEDFADLGRELAQTPGSSVGSPMLWSVTPEGVVFATPPVRGVPLYAPQGPLPPSSYFTGKGQPRSWTLSGPLQPNFTPFDVLPGQSGTSRSLSQVRGASGPNARGAAGELHVAELSAGSQREVTLDLPGGLRGRSDVLSPTVAGTVNQEVKNYLRFRGSASGAREVQLTTFMQTEINRDAMAIYYYGHQPVWVFTDAPPSQALRLALEQAGIPYVVSTDRLPVP
jgi:hypothetical protein